MTKKNRLIASVLALTVVFVMLFSVGFVIAEAGHDCTGDDCPICCQISVCRTTLRSIGFAAAAAIFTRLFDTFTVALPALAKRLLCHTSLVSLKVKLSN